MAKAFAKKLNVAVLFCWVMALLCVWCNFKDENIWMLVVSYLLGSLEIIVFNLIGYYYAQKEVKSFEINFIPEPQEDTREHCVITYKFREDCGHKMVAVFDTADVPLDYVVEVVDKGLFDSRIMFMSERRYRTLEVPPEEENLIYAKGYDDNYDE